MSEWQPIETAPKDGTVFYAYFGGIPRFVAWFPASGSVRTIGHLWWRRRIEESEEAGFYVVMFFDRGGYWARNGNCPRFTPSHWMPLPDPPGGTVR